MFMKKNNYLLPFSVLLALGITNKTYAQEALKPSSAATDTKAAAPASFMALEGRILDSDSNPVPFATITLKGTGKTVQADANGNYRFYELKPGSYTAYVSKAGFESSEINFTIEAPKLRQEQSGMYNTPNNKSINASPVIRDIILQHASV
jgi:protocatechuate 3,4-dioxygenase beta subunit